LFGLNYQQDPQLPGPAANLGNNPMNCSGSGPSEGWELPGLLVLPGESLVKSAAGGLIGNNCSGSGFWVAANRDRSRASSRQHW